MAEKTGVNVTTSKLIARIRERFQDNLNARSPNVARALKAAGLIITSQAKINAPIDKGALRNSIAFKVGTSESGRVAVLTVGSFGVPYAAYQEFGFRGTVLVRSHVRQVTQVFGRKLAEPVVAIIDYHDREVNYAGKPYLIPAIESTRGRVVNAIRRELFRSS